MHGMLQEHRPPSPAENVSLVEHPKPRDQSAIRPGQKSPLMFIVIFAVWIGVVAHFHPRLWSLLDASDSWWGHFSIGYFIIFAELAWLYGIYNVAVVLHAAFYGNRLKHHYERTDSSSEAFDVMPPVAMLYTTCNDFVAASAETCLAQSYDNARLYILDDSSDDVVREEIDQFAKGHPCNVTVIRRPERTGAKAGNLNYALTHVVQEPLFAIVDADEKLPADFLSRLVPRLMSDPSCGFVQANHRAEQNPSSPLARDMGVGVDIHWKWYQPLRNRFGFVMFLGHGAVLRRECWDQVGGFPELVSEDLAYAIALREKGYHGLFAEDVICEEQFPETVRAFRIRHVKWTRGTCEFLHHWAGRLLKAKNITLSEKLDILFPTLNLPMTFFFFLFMVNAQTLFPMVLGEIRLLTIELGSTDLTVPVLSMKDDMVRVFGPDFFAITLLTVMAPVLCFVVELWRKPVTLFSFLTNSTALYAALSPLSFVSVVGYALTRKATFLVTGDRSRNRRPDHSRRRLSHFLKTTHPASQGVVGFEIFVGIAFAIMAVISVQISFLGLSLAFLLLPAAHQFGWNQRGLSILRRLPFLLILSGIMLGGMGLAGLQPMFFGFGFHF